MLPAPLLRARARKGSLVLFWATGRPLEEQLASELTDCYKRHVGKKSGDLSEQLEDIEDYYEAMGLDYRFIRGLSLLLERKCDFGEPKAPVPPTKARRKVFELCNLKYSGFASNRGEREAVLEEAASELGVSRGELEEAMWADRDKNLELLRFDEPEAGGLLRQYNQSLLQTALFRAVSLHIGTEASGHELRELMRAIKFRRLMYFADKVGKALRLRIDGPSSVLRLTTRYGTSLAKLVPHVISLGHWSIEATVVRKVGDQRRLLRLRVTDAQRGLFPEREAVLPAYDSEVERDFARMMTGMGWGVEREPEPLVVDGGLMLPDFGLSKGPLKMHVEIVGFWTPEYLERKLDKLPRVKESLLLLVDEKLACAKMEKAHHEVIYYKGRLNLPSIARRLSEIEEREWERVAGILRQKLAQVDFGRISEVGELAGAIGATPDQVVSLLREEPPPGYVVVSDVLIDKGLLGPLRKQIEDSGAKTLSEVERVLVEAGFSQKYHVPLLTAAGYRILWRTLDRSDAEIVPTSACRS